MNLTHKEITISGIVQGVGFRYSCLRIARSMGIRGFVKNSDNGDVYIEAEGEEYQLQLFLKWCWEGSSHARITNVSHQNGKPKHYKVFEIKH